MKLKRPLLIVTGLLVVAMVGILGLRLDWFEESPVRQEGAWSFHDDFENAHTFRDLFPQDLSRWHNQQLVPESNVVDLSTEVAHSGKQSLKCYAQAKRGDITSKADVLRAGLHFVKGDHVWSQCWLLLKGDASGENLFLWDLEASGKWQSPGRRIFLEKGDRIASDLGKWFSSSVFRQPHDGGSRFPRDRWVRLRVHLFLSESNDGVMEVWQDDTQVINSRGQTLPTAKAIYDRLEVGITANGSTEQAHTLFVDDVIISNRPVP